MKWMTFLLVLSPSLAHPITVEEAAQEAARTPSPKFEEILTNDTRLQTLPTDAFGSTESLEKLKGKDGMGDIFSPASSKAQSCLSQGDPECLAIQVVRRHSGQKPELDKELKDQIQNDYQSTIEKAEEITDNAMDIVSGEVHCETVQTVIPGREEIEICDEGLASEAIICQEGWEMNKELNILYHCSLTSSSVVSSCQIKRKVHAHRENILSCLDTPAEIQETVCRYVNRPKIKQTFPYQCEIHESSEIKQTCVKTLDVEVILACSQAYTSSDSLEIFKEVGYNASDRYQAVRITQACSDRFLSMPIKFGTRTVATFTQVPSTVTGRYVLDFNFSINEDESGYLITITNVQTGQGTRTLNIRHPKLSTQIRQVDHWTETCR